jgi:uncharacterized membrane protein YdjX (TVP38/TMEM64 family)
MSVDRLPDTAAGQPVYGQRKRSDNQMGDDGTGTNGGPSGFGLRKIWPLLILAAGFLLFFVTGADRYVTFEALQTHHDVLNDWMQNRLAASIALFLLAYVALTAFSLPIASLVSIVGGYMYGSFLGTTLVVIGATVGATILFLAARSSIGDSLRAREGPAMRRMEAGFRRNAFNYLLVLRLVPIFPFFLVNLAPAFLGVPLRIYVLATFIGIIPGSFVYVQIGAGLDSILDTQGEISVGDVLTGDVVIALVGLAILSMIPVFYRYWSGRRDKQA